METIITTKNSIDDFIPKEIPLEIKESVDFLADTLDEFVRYGANIILWDVESKLPSNEDIPPQLMFRNFLDLIDSISILIRQGNGDTTKLLGRACLELMLNLEYLFEENTFDRAIAFLVEDRIKTIRKLRRHDPRTEDSRSFFTTLKKEDFDIVIPEHLLLEVNRYHESSNDLFSKSPFDKAYNEFEKLKSLKRGNASWFSYYNGPATIEDLARKLGRSALYEIIYREWSNYVHGKSKITKIVNSLNLGYEIVQLRHSIDIGEVVKTIIPICQIVFSTYVNNRVPNRLKDYGEWYFKIRDRILLIRE